MPQQRYSARTNEQAIAEYSRLLDHRHDKQDTEPTKRQAPKFCVRGLPGCTVRITHPDRGLCDHCLGRFAA